MTSETTPIAAGMRVLCRDAEWLVTGVEHGAGYNGSFAVRCVGADDLVRGHERIFLTDLDEVVPVDPRNTRLVADASSGYRQAKLFLEAQLRQMPVTDTEPDLLGRGAFEPMRFQEEAVHRALLQMRPRLLLADSVGLGKTIEVGMILTELQRRGRANRILVLAKKSMLTQFQSELWNRFCIPLVRLDSQGIARLRLRIPASKNPFEVYHRVIISIDTLKDVARYRHFLEQTRWDVVVIDEAHNVAGASVPERHLSHRLAKLLARRCDSLLLTTATPHNGKRETFGRLISLLDPSAIPDPSFREYSAEDIKSFFLMRFKEDVREEAGGNLSTREVRPLASTTVDATPEEEAVYGLLAELRRTTAGPRNGFALGVPNGERGDTLLRYGLYKRFLSSPEACLATVRSRLKRLADVLLDPEVEALKRLEKDLSRLSLRGSSRYGLLVRQLRDMGWTGQPDSPRVLVFTEARQTQDALAAALAQEFGLRFDPAFEAQATQPIGIVHGSTPDVHLMSSAPATSPGCSAASPGIRCRLTPQRR